MAFILYFVIYWEYCLFWNFFWKLGIFSFIWIFINLDLNNFFAITFFNTGFRPSLAGFQRNYFQWSEFTWIPGVTSVNSLVARATFNTESRLIPCIGSSYGIAPPITRPEAGRASTVAFRALGLLS